MANPREGCLGIDTDLPAKGMIAGGEPPSILIVMLSALGDAVQVLPVVTALKRRFPRTHITWLIQPGPREMVGAHPAVDEFVVFRRGPRSRTPAALFRGARALIRAGREIGRVAAGLPGTRFDLVLDLQVYLKAGILTFRAPSKMKLGFDFRRTRDLNWLFTTHRIPPPPARFAHIQDQYFEFLRYLGIDPEPVSYGLALTSAEERRRSSFFQELDRPACGLVLATSNPRKDWRPEGYVRVADRVYRELDLQPILLGGGSAREAEMARRIKRQSRVPVLDARAPGLRRLLWLLGGCRVVVSPDTGPLHMARALEVPVVGLYGYTNPRRSGPYRMYGDLVVDGYARYPGEPYPLNPKRRSGGMDRITPEMVLEKVRRALERYG